MSNPLSQQSTLSANGAIHAIGGAGGRFEWQFVRFRVTAYTSGNIVTTTYIGPNFVSVQFTGTFTATVTFEASNDGNTFIAFPMTPIAGGADATTATAPGMFSRAGR